MIWHLFKRLAKKGLLLVIIATFFSGCVSPVPFEPTIVYCPSARVVDSLPSPFPPLSNEDKETAWGKELYLGLRFEREFDLYRAITCYKSALFLAPQERASEIEYRLIESYYLGRKYEEAIEIFENGCISREIALSAPGGRELLLILYDSYKNLNRFEKAERIRCLIESFDEKTASELNEYEAIKAADFCSLNELQDYDRDLPIFLDTYAVLSKSVKKAQFLNAVLPGAGYYYVGQKKTAVTAFIVNALFTWAAYEFFDRGYIAAGLITTSFEMGWYLGGINGAGLAANQINESTYSTLAKDFLCKRRLFPLLMFNYAF